MSVETLVKISLIVLFLLFAYFMIGGYTPCPSQYYPMYPEYGEHMRASNCDGFSCHRHNLDRGYNYNTVYPDGSIEEELRKVGSPYPKSGSVNGKNIYQMGPYLNI